MMGDGKRAIMATTSRTMKKKRRALEKRQKEFSKRVAARLVGKPIAPSEETVLFRYGTKVDGIPVSAWEKISNGN